MAACRRRADAVHNLSTCAPGWSTLRSVLAALLFAPAFRAYRQVSAPRPEPRVAGYRRVGATLGRARPCFAAHASAAADLSIQHITAPALMDTRCCSGVPKLAVTATNDLFNASYGSQLLAPDTARYEKCAPPAPLRGSSAGACRLLVREDSIGFHASGGSRCSLGNILFGEPPG
jgi:hypothetical protein